MLKIPRKALTLGARGFFVCKYRSCEPIVPLQSAYIRAFDTKKKKKKKKKSGTQATLNL